MEASAARRKTSLAIDFEKVDAVKDVLGTKTLTETIDAALDEILLAQQRRTLFDLISTPGAFDLLDPDVMAGAWR